MLKNNFSVTEQKAIRDKYFEIYKTTYDGDMEAVYEEIIADVLSGQTEYTDRFQREINEFWEDVYGVSDSGTYAEMIDKGKYSINERDNPYTKENPSSD